MSAGGALASFFGMIAGGGIAAVGLATGGDDKTLVGGGVVIVGISAVSFLINAFQGAVHDDLNAHDWQQPVSSDRAGAADHTYSRFSRADRQRPPFANLAREQAVSAADRAKQRQEEADKVRERRAPAQREPIGRYGRRKMSSDVNGDKPALDS